MEATTETPTITVNVPEPDAEKLLAQTGWRVAGSAEWVRPGGVPRDEGGQFGKDFLWHRDEALLQALQTLAVDFYAGKYARVRP